MSRQSHTTYEPEDFFSHQTLELSFRLLRNNSPGLAFAIKKTLDQISWVPYDILKGMHTGEMHFNAELVAILNVHTLGKIVSALTDIGEQALTRSDLPQDHVNLLRTVIDDWAQLTEWVLKRNIDDKSATL